jgi:uncharacterized protein (DUF885 family)
VRVVVVALLSGSLVVSAACGRGDAGAPLEGDGALAHVLSGYVVDFLRRNPTANTYLGGAGLDPSLRDVDGMLRDHSAEALVEEDEWLRASQRAIEAVPVDSLSPGARVDRDVALAQIRFLLRQHGVRRYQERALDTYVSEPLKSVEWQIQGFTETGDDTYGTPEEWDLLIRRVGAIPEFLAMAQAQLEAGVVSRRIPDWRMAQRDGLEMSEAHAKYFAETLPAVAAERLAGPEGDRLLKELGAAAQRASEAYLTLRDFVAATYFDGAVPKYAADRFAIGEEEYNWTIGNGFRINPNASQLYDLAWPVIESTRTAMVDVARRIGRQRSLRLPAGGMNGVRAVFEVLSRESPRSDAEMMSWYRNTAARLVEYGRKTNTFDVSADYGVDVAEPVPSRQPGGMAHDVTSPFTRKGVGLFYVMPAGDDPGALGSNSRTSLARLVGHEGFPGHDWYFKGVAESRAEISPVRWLLPGAVTDSSSMWLDSMSTEAWAFYAEALLAESRPEAPDGVYTLEERLYYLRAALYSELLVRIDTGIHIGRLTYEEAVALFSEVVDFLPGSCAGYIATPFRPAALGGDVVKRASCEAAERAIFQQSKWPAKAITYRLGKEEVYALRSAAAARLGEELSLQTFHRRLIRQGPIPAGYVREALLNELDQPGS